MAEHIIVEKRSNTAATVSVTIAIIGFTFSLIPLFGWLTLPTWVMAILFGIIGLFKEYKRGMAIAGIVIGLFTFMYKIFIFNLIFG